MSKNTWAGVSVTAAFLSLTNAAFSQDAQPTRVRGTLDQVSGDTLMVKPRSGGTATVQLKEGVPSSPLPRARCPISKKTALSASPPCLNRTARLKPLR